MSDVGLRFLRSCLDKFFSLVNERYRRFTLRCGQSTVVK